VASSFQFLVEIIQQKIRQKWGQGTALWSSLFTSDTDSITHQSGLNKGTDELKQSFVSDMTGNSRHQHVMIHTVKELLQINVNHCDPVIFYILLRLL
jgi:hypothetical protein